MTHGIDCDGYVTLHLGRVRLVSKDGRGLWQAQCLLNDGVLMDSPHWVGSLVGPGARDLAAREAAEHCEEGRCHGCPERSE